MMPSPPLLATRRTARALLPALLVILVGCSAEHYRKDADKEVYSIISAKTPQVPGMEASFRLEQAEGVPTAADIVAAAREGKLAALSVPDAIAIAAANNRDFLRRREEVYLQALDLTYQRYLFSPQFSGALSGLFKHSTTDENSVDGDSSLGVTQTLATGAEAGLKLSSSFLRFLTGDPRTSASSVLEFTLTQPLVRGAWKRIAEENLVQSERDMIYELRSFVQYRREFSVSVARDYFGVLQQRDVAENQRLNLENLTVARQRAEKLGEAGRLPGSQVDQTVQDELSARDSWVQAVQQYEQMLEDFKIELGVPPETPLTLDEAEMARLRAAPMPEFDHTRDEAARLALSHRLDLTNAQDAAADAERKVEVARNALGPGVNLVLTAGLGTEPMNRPLAFAEDEGYYSAGLDVDLPLDRLQQRNAYRRSLITLDRQKRGYELTRDQVVQQVNRSWRKLNEARQRSEIQRMSVDLARQRVDSTTMLIDAGRAEMRDLLDAQASLVRARNAHSQTMVNYRMATLEMWRDMGILAFRDGQFTEEIEDADAERQP